MKRSGSKLLLITAVIIIPLFLLALAVAGISIGYGLTSAATASNGSQASELSPAEVEAELLSIAAGYAASGDLETASQQLDALNLPNTGQYVSFMVDRYIQEGREDESDTQNLFMLANALGTGTDAMAQALASPTLLPTATLPPTSTPVPTETPLAEPTKAAPAAENTQAPAEEPTPTETALPTETPVPPTETPVPPTNTPAPPTNTPEPTPTPEPTQPAVDFLVTEAYLIPNPSYNTCPGSHQIFVTILDANGNPMDGVTVEDTFRAVPPHVSGEKGPGKLEYDLWNNGFSLEVTKKADGSPATSEVTPKLSSWDEDIPNEWLVQANYCRDLADCAARKSQNQLCRGHYSYNVTFQRTY